VVELLLVELVVSVVLVMHAVLATVFFIHSNTSGCGCPKFISTTIDGRNPAPLGMYKTL